MLDGTQFVEAVSRLGYPGAAALKGEDFDWLFDVAELRQFLHFFCGSITLSHVLAPDEVQAFQALREAGKPILDEAALAETLKACQTAPSRDPGNLAAWLEEADVAQLEGELQALRQEKKLKLRRHRKMQVLAASRADVALRLAGRQEESSLRLKDTVATLGAENAETNSTLQALSQEVKRLATFLSTDLEDHAGPPASLVPGPSVFFSQLSLESYLQQEEANTKTLALLARKQFFPGVFNMVDASNSENFQLLDFSSCLGERDGGAVEAHCTEMTRLQWAHVVAQHGLLQSRAEEHAISAGLQWIAERVCGKVQTQTRASMAGLQACEAELRRQLGTLEAELEALAHGRTPEALRASALLLSVPVVRGDFDLQVAHQDYYTSRQDGLCSVLLRQKASLELLQLAHELELRRERLLCRQLGEAAQRLEAAHTASARRLQVYARPELCLAPRPCSIITAKDAAFSRLYKVLEADGGPEQDQPFRTYEGLAQAALSLQEALCSAQEALAAAARGQALGAARLEGDCDTLREATYCRLQQPVLKPQVCVLTTQELCPNTQELKEALQQLESQLDSLNKLMKEILVDIRGKRDQLERSSVLRQERDLYVAFHLDPKQLRKTVEELESLVVRPGSRP
ncbi:HAUS augmin-like complex subunit 3 isoform X1 [Brienomyrus brachyistius]|uniref:HAUS augmin-like complex subunit 3 isoform X1 n=1 Tax=Brienomyrus brachyistius TaxID=42636 RepID=UPI0020B30DC6|nr:HAUS augmin-like complex subunit 3 isoform X1 [Brienomyrus brachyistius]XP_048827236.1 HAUS augmin-like complex subunit 3 isoform X1 [Brienomyrus brachyistius]